MKTETFKGSVESAYGEKLPTAVAFQGSFQAFESYEEAQKANELLSNDEHLNAINAKRKAAARAKATTDALNAAGISKPDPNSPEVIKANMVKMTMKLYSLDEATATKIVEASAAAAQAVK